MGLNGELRRATQEDIDLYLTHPCNTKITDYTEGGSFLYEDAIKNMEKREMKKAIKVLFFRNCVPVEMYKSIIY